MKKPWGEELKSIGQTGGEGNLTAGKTQAVDISFLNHFFEHWEQKGVQYCVLRGLERFPAAAEGDVDILVSSEDAESAALALSQPPPEILLLRVRRKEYRQLFSFASRRGLEDAAQSSRPLASVVVDLQTRLQWRGLEYIDARTVLDSRTRKGSYYVAQPAHQAAILLCHDILEKGSIKSSHWPILEAAVSEDHHAITRVLEASVGRETAIRLQEAVQSGQPERVLELRKVFIGSLLRRSPASAIGFLGYLARKGERFLLTALLPSGILLATAGPDGSGKSTLIARLETLLGGTFFPMRKQRMGGGKDFVLPTKRLLNWIRRWHRRSGEPTPRKWEREELLQYERIDNLAVLHYFLDLWVRYLLKVRPTLVRGGLVLCDRYYYDLFARDVYVCRNGFWRGVLLALIPTPTLTVLFGGDAETLASRKPEEISPAEASRQLQIFASLRERMRNVVGVDVAGSVEMNVATVVEALGGVKTGERSS